MSVIFKCTSLLRRYRTRASSLLRIFLLKALSQNIDIHWSALVSSRCSIVAHSGGTIRIGPGSYLGPGSVVTAGGGARDIGSCVHIAHGCTIVSRQRIEIGDDTQIAEYVTIRDQDHHYVTDGLIRSSGFQVSPIVIAGNVWLGAKSSVLRGSVISYGAVVGAHSVVKGDIPTRAVAAGIPAATVRKY